MANPLTQEPGVGSPTTGAPIETGMSDVAWGTAILGSQFPEITAQSQGYFQLSAVGLNDTFTNLTVNNAFTPITNAALQIRPNFESHAFIQSHWIVLATAGASQPASSAKVEIQLWLNGYFVLISPSGYGNDWIIQIPPVPAGTSMQLNMDMQAWIFNLEFRAAPNAHNLQFMYNVTSLDANWSVFQVKPRMMMALAYPSTQLTFVNLNGPV